MNSSNGKMYIFFRPFGVRAPGLSLFVCTHTHKHKSVSSCPFRLCQHRFFSLAKQHQKRRIYIIILSSSGATITVVRRVNLYITSLRVNQIELEIRKQNEIDTHKKNEELNNRNLSSTNQSIPSAYLPNVFSAYFHCYTPSPVHIRFLWILLRTQ